MVARVLLGVVSKCDFTVGPTISIRRREATTVAERRVVRRRFVLFTGLASVGHTYPLIPLAIAARDAGHGVHFAAGEDIHAPLAANGLRPFRPADSLYDVYAEDLEPELARLQRRCRCDWRFRSLMPWHVGPGWWSGDWCRRRMCGRSPQHRKSLTPQRKEAKTGGETGQHQLKFDFASALGGSRFVCRTYTSFPRCIRGHSNAATR
jgi:hypothetical protein